MNFHDLYAGCRLCARNCGVDRTSGEIGACCMPDRIYLSRAALHAWEEPPISGKRGSGAVFFTGCSLGCIYCQNREISRGGCGIPVTVDRLSQIMLELQGQGAHNIDLVTPTHYVPSILDACDSARQSGMNLPIVYNTASYENPQTIALLKGTVDIYLPDLKYATEKTASAYSFAGNYPSVARQAIDRMVKQVGKPVLDEEGIMKKGVIVRILLLPGHLAEAKLSLSYLYKQYGNDIYISLMNQYTPMPGMKKPLDRTVTHEEYRDFVDYADRLGITNAFTQEFGTQKDSFIPAFDFTGVESEK